MQVKSLLSGLVFILVASVCGVMLAIWVFKNFNIYIPLKDQNVNIDLKEPLEAEVKIHDALDVDVTGRVNASIPIKETLNIPLKQTLKPMVYFDNQVPIKTVIPVRENLNIQQDMSVDTTVKVKVFGRDIKLPLRGNIPIQLNVPISMDVPLEQNIHLKFNAPVETVLKENLIIPLDATLKTNIPIQGHLNVPIKTALKASVDVQNTLPVKIEKGDLKIPLNTLTISKKEQQAANPSVVQEQEATSTPVVAPQQNLGRSE